MTFDGLDAGDETRRNGDYVGLPHTTNADGSGGPSEGELVLYDGSTISAASADPTGETIAGVLYTYQYYGEDNQIRTDRDATVKTSGTVIADLSTQEGGTDAVEPGAALGANGEVLVLEASDSGTDHYEVLLR